MIKELRESLRTTAARLKTWWGGEKEAYTPFTNVHMLSQLNDMTRRMKEHEAIREKFRNLGADTKRLAQEAKARETFSKHERDLSEFVGKAPEPKVGERWYIALGDKGAGSWSGLVKIVSVSPDYVKYMDREDQREFLMSRSTWDKVAVWGGESAGTKHLPQAFPPKEPYDPKPKPGELWYLDHTLGGKWSGTWKGYVKVTSVSKQYVRYVERGVEHVEFMDINTWAKIATRVAPPWAPWPNPDTQPGGKDHRPTEPASSVTNREFIMPVIPNVGSRWVHENYGPITVTRFMGGHVHFAVDGELGKGSVSQVLEWFVKDAKPFKEPKREGPTVMSMDAPKEESNHRELSQGVPPSVVGAAVDYMNRVNQAPQDSPKEPEIGSRWEIEGYRGRCSRVIKVGAYEKSGTWVDFVLEDMEKRGGHGGVRMLMNQFMDGARPWVDRPKDAINAGQWWVSKNKKLRVHWVGADGTVNYTYMGHRLSHTKSVSEMAKFLTGSKYSVVNIKSERERLDKLHADKRASRGSQ